MPSGRAVCAVAPVLTSIVAPAATSSETITPCARTMASSEQVGDDTIRGSVASGYEDVQTVFRGFFDRGWDVGSGVSVYVGGEPVVRLTGGSRVVASGDAAAYDASTIQLVASTTK